MKDNWPITCVLSFIGINTMLYAPYYLFLAYFRNRIIKSELHLYSNSNQTSNKRMCATAEGVLLSVVCWTANHLEASATRCR